MTRIAPTPLSQEVAERLRQRIFAHELTPGTWIDEQKLAEQHSWSHIFGAAIGSMSTNIGLPT